MNARRSIFAKWCAGWLLVASACTNSVPLGDNGVKTGTGASSACSTGLTCGAGCVDPMTDLANCGSCGTLCPEGQSCQQGVCGCTAPLQLCGTTCVDIGSNVANCGACGKTCGAEQVCSQSACSPNCAQGLTRCGASCVDINTNPLDCGGCGLECGVGSTCVAGSCSPGPSTDGTGASSGAGATATGGSGPTASGGASDRATGGVDNTAAGSATTGGAGGVGAATSGGASATGGQATGGDEPVEPEPSLITSSSDGFWRTGEVTEATGSAGVTVDDGQVLGDWVGFGGTFNEKGWEQLATLSEADRSEVMRLLFDRRQGIGFSLGRIPIGSSDYAMSRYSLDETPNDTSMASFSIQRDQERLIPFIEAALAVRSDIWFWASPWSPPTWMKTADTPADQYGEFDDPFDGGTIKNEPAILDAHALYLAKFVKAYAQLGITISAVHPQNEPGWAQHYPSCSWASGSGYLYDEYIKDHLAPTFEREGVTAEIWLGTLSNQDKDHALAQEVLNDPSARALISGIGLQWELLNKLSDYTNKGLPVWQTEHKCGNYPWQASTYQQSAPNDYAYAKESWGLIRDWIRGGVSAYMAWNMVLDSVGKSMDTKRVWAQNALVTVSGGKYTLTPTYYVFRHVAQYVEPGAKRVQISSNEGLAFKNPDGSIVAILYSQAGGQTTLGAGGRTVQFQIPADGWATVNLQAQ